MRAPAHGREDDIGKRFAIVIGAAVGVMALGAQMATAGEPDLQLSGKKKQELGKAVKVKASCGEVACSAIAHAKLTHVTKPCGCPGGGDGIAPVSLKPASADLGPGETTTLKLKYDKKTRKKAGKVLAEGKKVRARVTVRAKDAAGDVAVEKHTIKLVK